MYKLWRKRFALGIKKGVLPTFSGGGRERVVEHKQVYFCNLEGFSEYHISSWPVSAIIRQISGRLPDLASLAFHNAYVLHVVISQLE